MPNTTRTTAAHNTAVTDALAGLVKTRLAYKPFSTGSKGFFGQDKITVDGKTYQAQVQAILIGSKANPEMEVRANTEQVKAALTAGLIANGVPPTNFVKSGKTGYRAQAKVTIGDETYQSQVQAVLLVKK
jgi:hypothetical protein